MPDEKHEPDGLKVVDRRRFTAEGELRPDAPAAAEPVAAATAPAAAAPAPESPQARQARQDYQCQSAGARAMDFETLVVSISTSAMLQLGMGDDPAQGRMPPDLEGARQTIDLLSVLEEKTRGNLAPREKQVLEEALFELRRAWLELARQNAGGLAEKAPRAR